MAQEKPKDPQLPKMLSLSLSLRLHKKIKISSLTETERKNTLLSRAQIRESPKHILKDLTFDDIGNTDSLLQNLGAGNINRSLFHPRTEFVVSNVKVEIREITRLISKSEHLEVICSAKIIHELPKVVHEQLI